MVSRCVTNYPDNAHNRQPTLIALRQKSLRGLFSTALRLTVDGTNVDSITKISYITAGQNTLPFAPNSRNYAHPSYPVFTQLSLDAMSANITPTLLLLFTSV